MPTSIQIRAQELLDAHNEDLEVSRKFLKSGARAGGILLKAIGAAPVAPLLGILFDVVPVLHGWLDGSKRELEKVVRGERDTLPEPPEVSDESYYIACS